MNKIKIITVINIYAYLPGFVKFVGRKEKKRKEKLISDSLFRLNAITAMPPIRLHALRKGLM